MPELPEVETIRLNLLPKLIGLKIKDINALNQNSFEGDIKKVIGSKIKNIFRRAKVLGIELDNEMTLLIHLKMSGQLVYELPPVIPAQAGIHDEGENNKRFYGGHPTLDMNGLMPNNSTRVIFEFSDSSKLYFNDQRKFGWIKLIKSKEVSENKFLKTLGPEPLEKDFTWQILKKNLLKRKTLPVKTAILDQTVVSGVGNIYASEACFIAKINPTKKVKDLTDDEFKKLYQGIKVSLQNGIKHGGSTLANFINPEGEKGYYLDYAFVYFKAGKPCKICKTKIEKIQLNGRGTYFCPNCQVV